VEPLALVFLVLFLLALAGAAWLLVERSRWQGEQARLAAERDAARAQLPDAERSRESFRALAGEVLKSSNEEFLRLAGQTLAARETQAVAAMDKRQQAVDALIKPIQEAIQRTQGELAQFGKEHAGLRSHVVEMGKASQELRAETSKLAQALAKPNVRGRYGEIVLERVLELAGMRNWCDFTPQESVADSEGRLQRPDVVVKLPSGRVVAVDSKTSLDAYMKALEAKSPEEQTAQLDRYAQHVVEQVQRLAKKGYWSRFDESPEFVVMFLPGDQLVDAALERRPDLVELAAQNNVVLASPSTLIGLLRAIHVGWREKQVTDKAQELFQLGRLLHERTGTVLDHVEKVGAGIDSARKGYNELVGSLQGRLIPTLRRFEQEGARSSKELCDPTPIEGELRALESARGRSDVLLPAERKASEPSG
jgi:DNA recombination protein RmuC